MLITLGSACYSQGFYYAGGGYNAAFLKSEGLDYGITVKGIGVDEETAACIDEDGHVQVFGINNAYFCRQTNLAPEGCVSGHELTWKRGEQAVTVSSSTPMPFTVIP